MPVPQQAPSKLKEVGGGALAPLLLAMSIVSEDVLQKLISRSGGDETLLERFLLSEGYLTAEQLGLLKSQAYGWHFVDLQREPIVTEALALLPQATAEAKGAIPYLREGVIHIALLNPRDGKFIRLLQKRFGPDLSCALATPAAIAAALAHYDVEASERCAKIAERAQQEGGGTGKDVSIVELIDTILLHCVRQNVSDIHIEPRREGTVVRVRIDGLLRSLLQFSKDVHEHVVLRIKVLANLALDEHARPQDGKISYTPPDGRRVDIRVSSVPTTKGEKIVLRILVPEDEELLLESLGLSEKNRFLLEEETKRSWGMVLVTGPTGSGKTTTLYALMRRLNSEEKNISTIEDPVEYELPGANQIQVNEKVGMTFANGLRSIVRQDPNIILVGEIRDQETAGIAVNAAMTGHIVLSTLHTNDAATALPRLIDMNVEPFLIASTVNVIVAQRLVRTICVRCRESVDLPIKEVISGLPPELKDALHQQGSTIRLYRGKGCTLCQGSGFYRRTGIFEILQVDETIQELITSHTDAAHIRKIAMQAGMKGMISDGLEKALQGMTTIEEILRVTRL